MERLGDDFLRANFPFLPEEILEQLINQDYKIEGDLISPNFYGSHTLYIESKSNFATKTESYITDEGLWTICPLRIYEWTSTTILTPKGFVRIGELRNEDLTLHRIIPDNEFIKRLTLYYPEKIIEFVRGRGFLVGSAVLNAFAPEQFAPPNDSDVFVKCGSKSVEKINAFVEQIIDIKDSAPSPSISSLETKEELTPEQRAKFGDTYFKRTPSTITIYNESSLKFPVEFVAICIDTAKEVMIHAKFDAHQICYDGKYLYYTDEFIKAITEKKIHKYYPRISSIRMKRVAKQGFEVPNTIYEAESISCSGKYHTPCKSFCYYYNDYNEAISDYCGLIENDEYNEGSIPKDYVYDDSIITIKAYSGRRCFIHDDIDPTDRIVHYNNIYTDWEMIDKRLLINLIRVARNSRISSPHDSYEETIEIQIDNDRQKKYAIKMLEKFSYSPVESVDDFDLGRAMSFKQTNP